MVGFFTAPAVAWGPGALQQLSGLGARRAVVVIDPSVARAEGPRRAVEELERAEATVLVVSDPPAVPRTADVAALAAHLRAFDPDWIVAVGGGSTIDAVKAARLLLERPDLLLDRPVPDAGLPPGPRTHLVAVPTTSGSGAEASWTVDLFAADGAPVELAHRSLVPEWAIVDPKFAAGLPREAQVAGALEAAALACEAYLSAWSNPFSEALAVDALRTVTTRLPHALRWSDDVDARAALHYAATCSGLAHSNAQRGLAHALARALQRPTGLGYALLLGIVLPAVLEFDRPAAREQLEALTATLSGGETGPMPSLVERARRLQGVGGVPGSLRAAGAADGPVRAERARIVAETLRSPAVLANPRVPSATDVEALLATLLGPEPEAPPRPAG